MTKWLMTAAAVMLIASGARADNAAATTSDDNSWLCTRLTFDNTSQLFNANEVSLDLFGTYQANERHFLAWPNTAIKDGNWGGGVGGNYFFTRELGIGVETAFLAGTQHFADHFGADLYARIPIEVMHLAPYVLGGGGRAWNPSAKWFADVGVGVEFRFNPKLGLFGDVRYIWKEDNQSDQAALRLGMRLVF